MDSSTALENKLSDTAQDGAKDVIQSEIKESTLSDSQRLLSGEERSTDSSSLDSNLINGYFRDADNYEIGLNFIDFKRTFYMMGTEELIEQNAFFNGNGYKPVFPLQDVSVLFALFFSALCGGFALNALVRLSGFAVQSVRDIFHKVV